MRYFVITLLAVLVTASQVSADTYGSVDDSVIRRSLAELDPLSSEERNALLARLDDKDFLAVQYILDFGQLDEANNDRYYDLYEEMYSNARGSMSEADHQLVLRLMAEWSYRELQYLDPENAYYDIARMLLAELGTDDPTIAAIKQSVNESSMSIIDMRYMVEKVEEYCSTAEKELSPEGMLYLRLLRQEFAPQGLSNEEVEYANFGQRTP
ncbi:hypothetical protein KDL44_00590 [bacterium]|nr:hypothetical protein [bacterium]